MRKRKKKEYSLASNLWFLLREADQAAPLLVRLWIPLFILASVVQQLFQVLIPARAVYVVGNKMGAVAFLIQVGGIIFLFLFFKAVSDMAREKYETESTIIRVYEFVGKMVEKSLTTDYCNRETHANQKLIDRANNALNGNLVGVELIYRQLPNAVMNFIGMLLFGGAILTVDIRILLVLVLMLICNVAANRYAVNYLNAHLEENGELSRKVYTLKNKAGDIVCGKDIRLYRMEKWFGALLQSYVEWGQRWQKGVEKHYYLPVLSDTVFIALRDGIAYVILIQKVMSGSISLSVFTLMLGIVAGFSNWMFAAVDSVMDLVKANESISDLRRVLDMKDTFLHGCGYRISEQDLSSAPEIELRNVSFSYGEGEKNILSGLNLKIRAGEKIALVGSNGAGKTTLVKLLCGFYHPTGGQILINGRDVEEHDIDEYFRLVGVVFQDVSMLPYNLVNLVSGREKEDTDMDRFWLSVRRAGLYEKIQSLEKKEDTYISNIFDDNGIRLSGGETQKLMLARCIYKDAPFLILDEPTSALDPLAESAMYEEYNQLTEGKTSIFISHRLASTRFCDRILYLKDGQIAEEGTHDELLRSQGEYARIYEIQSSYYTKQGATGVRDGEEETGYEMQ